jgi:hypothetical protein
MYTEKRVHLRIYTEVRVQKHRINTEKRVQLRNYRSMCSVTPMNTEKRVQLRNYRSMCSVTSNE